MSGRLGVQRGDLRRGHVHQTVVFAMQVSPDGLVAFAVMRSAPAPSATRRRSSNEPLGARVVLVVETTALPLRRRTTFQRTPLRFWSTSNSVSRRPSSRLTLSLAVEPFEQVPRAVASSPPPCLATAVWGGGLAGREARRRRGRWLGVVMRRLSPPAGGTGNAT